MPWRRAWQPTPIFLPGESYGQRRLAGYDLQGHKELDTTKGSLHAQYYMYCCCLVAKSHPTLCDPMNGSPPGSAVYGISQARKLEWVAISFSRGSPRPRDQAWVSSLAGGFLAAELPYLYRMKERKRMFK